MRPDGADARALTTSEGHEREPAWSPDGTRIVFAADHGSGFELYVVDARGGEPERVLALDGDERTPSWSADDRVVFAHRGPRGAQWDLFLADLAVPVARRVPERLTETADDETHPRVSPSGQRVAFTSNRDADDGDSDIWVMPVLDRAARASGIDAAPAVRVVQRKGYDGYAAWSPDGGRLAYYSVRDGRGSTWVVDVAPETSAGVSRPSILASRHGGASAWSSDGQTLAIGEIPEPESAYNGGPRRETSDPPALFAGESAYRLWTVPAPRPVDDGTRPVVPAFESARSFATAFDDVWTTLRRLYYRTGESATEWARLRAEFSPRAAAARSEADLELIVDDLVSRQPLVGAAVTSPGAVVVSAHPLATAAGRRTLERGGNIVDAAIAVSFVLGVVEPDASGIGGDGQAVLFLKGMREPTVVEFKDQTPGAATLETGRLFNGTALVGNGPLSANVPGLVAGLDALYRTYGSGRIAWAELVAPAIVHADEGFALDETLPSSILEGRQYLQKHPAAAAIFLPGGRVPRAGDRFVNTDYAATLRTIATEGADAFYRGSIARRIAADMEANSGLITYDDLAQYRAIERKAVSGRYRGHVLFTGGPPVGAGVALLETFQVMDRYQPAPGATAPRDADYWHYLIEAWKVRDGVPRIADPAQWEVRFAEHLESEHAAALFERIDRAAAGLLPRGSAEATEGERIGSGTSGFVVADAEGNMIAVTQTLSGWGGSFYVSPGLGFLYNNHLRSNRTTPGAFGHLKPHTRSNTTNVPVLAFRDDGGQLTPRLALAAAGNAWIPASTYSVVTAVIDGRLSMQQAIEAPRFLVGRDPADASGRTARIEIEDRFPRAILRDLETRGHRFRKVGRKGELRYGFASGALVDQGRVEGGADPRRSHAAIAVEPLARLPSTEREATTSIP